MMHKPPASAFAVRLAVEDASVRRRVSRTVRHRIGAADAEDVSQAVFCDALGSATAPADPREIPFWLIGIAKNRAVDFFRRAPREIPSEDLDAWRPVAPSAFEVRDLARRVAHRCDEEQTKTLSWMLLEHEGVPLQDIAREQGLSPSAVRGRVYRLRRLLRREFAAMLAALLVAVGVGAGARAWREPPTRVDAAVSALPEWATGTFEVVDVTLPEATEDAVRMLVRAEARVARVSLRPGRLEVWTPTGTFTRRVPAVTSVDGGLALELLDPSGSVQRVQVTRDDRGRVLARSGEGKLQGTLVLRAVEGNRP